MNPLKDLKIAIIHDYLNQYGGAERVLELFHKMFPWAPVYTLVHDPKMIPNTYQAWDIHCSFLNKLPGIKRHYEKYIFLFPMAVESFDLGSYDLILSNSSAWAKGAKKTKNAFHVCYMLNAMRFVWDWRENALAEHCLIIRPLLNGLLNQIKRWDLTTAQNPDMVLVDSKEVQSRVRKYYGRESQILYPAIDTDYFMPGDHGTEDYYLLVSRLKPYKRVDIAIKAFNRNGRCLKIAGDGPEISRLKKMATGKIEFTGKVSDQQLLRLYQKCRALIFTPLEDFGITPLEAQACGRPVIAFGQGGALETVVEGQTGMFYSRQDPEDLANKIDEFEKREFSSDLIRQHALRFNIDEFMKKFKEKLGEGYSNFKKAI